MKRKLLIACDFDGTVTRNDTLVEILDHFGDSRWKDLQAQVVSGQIPIRQALERQVASVYAEPEELRRLLASEIELEASFPSFLEAMRRKGIPVVLLTGGFDLCVETVMTQAGLWPIPFLANRLERTDGTWKVQFPYPSPSCEACGHCKADPIQRWNSEGYTTVFVGNGVTDRCPARVAGLTFAKDELAQWCSSEGISVMRYKTFEDIHKELENRQWI